MRTIYLAGGCFWGMQKFFDQFDGVQYTEVGYANGPDTTPSYQDVCKSSGHAETVRIDYDPDRISLTQLLTYFFLVIDPLSVNRQGNDRGIQYRTGIYYTEESQLPEIREVYHAEEEKVGAKLAVEVEPLQTSFPPRNITRNIWTRIRAVTAISPTAILILNSRLWRKVKRSCVHVLAICPMRLRRTRRQNGLSAVSMTISLRRGCMSMWSAGSPCSPQ